MPKTYKNIVFTNHALARMNKRNISKDKIWKVVNRSDKKFKKGKETNKYIKTVDNRRYHVVAKYLKDEKKYLVISTWVRGEDDKQSFIWILITLPFKIIWWAIKSLFKK